MPTFRQRLCCFSILALLSAMSFGNSNQEPQQRPPTSQIQVHTGEVVVDANVTDRGGEPVRGLTESDFAVFEDGIEQQISSFRSISRSAPGQVYAHAQAQGKAAQPPDLVTDSLSYPHLISLVVDQVNMEVGDAARTTKAAQAYVDKFLQMTWRRFMELDLAFTSISDSQATKPALPKQSRRLLQETRAFRATFRQRSRQHCEVYPQVRSRVWTRTKTRSRWPIT